MKKGAKIKIRTKSEEERNAKVENKIDVLQVQKQGSDTTRNPQLIPESGRITVQAEQLTQQNSQPHNATRKFLKSKLSLALNQNQQRGLRSSQKRLLTKFQLGAQQNSQGALNSGRGFNNLKEILRKKS